MKEKQKGKDTDLANLIYSAIKICSDFGMQKEKVNRFCIVALEAVYKCP